MDITGTLVKSIFQQEFNRRDDVLITAFDFIAAAHFEKLLKIGQLRAEPHINLCCPYRGLESKKFFQDFQNVAARGKNPLDLNTQGVLQIFNWTDIEGVGHGNGNNTFLLIDRYHQVFQGKGSGDLVGNDVKFQLEGVYLDILNAGSLGNQFSNGVFGQFLLRGGYFQAERGNNLSR